jgi:hypothetical protein
LFRVGKIFEGFSDWNEGQMTANNFTSLLQLTSSIDLQPGLREAVKVGKKVKKIDIGVVSGWGSEPTIRGAEVKIADEGKCKKGSKQIDTICMENFVNEPYFCFGEFGKF